MRCRGASSEPPGQSQFVRFRLIGKAVNVLPVRGTMYWVTEDGSKPLRYDVDSLSTFWQRWNAGFIRPLPIENQL